jgi:hypothetical protein
MSKTYLKSDHFNGGGSGASWINLAAQILSHVDWFGRNAVCVAKSITQLVKRSVGLSVIVDTENKIIPRAVDWRVLCGHRYKLAISIPAARDVSTINRARMFQLASIDPENSRSEDRCNDRGKRGDPIMPDCFEYPGERFNEEDMLRGAFVVAIIGWIYDTGRGLGRYPTYNLHCDKSRQNGIHPKSQRRPTH